MALLIPTCAPIDLLHHNQDSRSCPQWEPLLEQHQPTTGWDTGRMSRIMWRESRCQPDATSRTADSGLLQINRVNHRWLSSRLGAKVDRQWLLDPSNNIRAAAALCVFWDRRRTTDCYHPWATS